MIFINIGIDVGGTHVGMGLVSDDGTILKRRNIFYDELTFDAEAVFEQIDEFVAENEDEAENVGIGIPGLNTGTFIDYTCNLPLESFEITDFIKTKLPIFVSNDSNCATIAEYEMIDRKMFSNYVLVTVGTGIGAGIILNEKLYTGTTGVAGEIGHMVIDKEGIPCNCGRRGCFERYASVSALLRNTELESLEEVFYLADRNNNIQKIVDSYIQNLAEGLANVINIYDPEMLVLGGSLTEYEKDFMYKLKSALASLIYNKYTYDINIKVAELKNDAGIIGASILNKYL